MSKNIEIDTYDEDAVCSPERTLLAAVVERSYRDLYSNNFTDFKNAISWILCTPKKAIPNDISLGVSFEHCYQILGFTATQVQFIKDIAIDFSHYLYDKKKFKADRKEVIKIRQHAISKNHTGTGTARRCWKRGYTVRT